ncbi:hypothetical protein [Scytonema sp. PCC 10023]|uniref:hypothetical protein n=1 Tax=Scytonema sp. PCC 10023 TaxID=1680591 RepID=UPI0039C5DA65
MEFQIEPGDRKGKHCPLSDRSDHSKSLVFNRYAVAPASYEGYASTYSPTGTVKFLLD